MKTISILTLAVALVIPTTTQAAHTSQEALEALERRYGAENFTSIVSITGTDGVPSPSEWWIVVHDPKMPSTLHTYWSGDRRVTDEGENRDYYPRRMPDGYVNRSKLQIDSTKAFEIVEREAAKMRIGFNEVSYELKAITLTDEPVWNLTLIDARGYFVGIVSVSGRTGNILRKVWMKSGGNGRGGFEMGVQDSIAPGDDAIQIPETPTGQLPGLPLVPNETLIPTEPTREGNVQDIVPVPLPQDEVTTLPPLPDVAEPIRPEVQEPTLQVPVTPTQTITPEPEPQRPSTNDSLYEEIPPEP